VWHPIKTPWVIYTCDEAYVSELVTNPRTLESLSSNLGDAKNAMSDASSANFAPRYKHRTMIANSLNSLFFIGILFHELKDVA
jgi:hypothetical protein